MMMTDVDLRDSSTSIVKVNKVVKRPPCSLAGLIIWGFVGIVLFILGLYALLIDPVSIIMKERLVMANGSYVHHMWEQWPIKTLIKVYVFNITNGEEFMNETDEKLALQELGPYVFRETRRNLNITYHDDGTMSFIPNSTVEFVPELSVGNLEDRILIPNMVVLMIASLTTNFLATIGLENIIKSSGQTYIQQMTVEELLISGHENNFSSFFNYSNHLLLNYKFGLLEKLYDTGEEIITMNLNKSTNSQYQIEQWDNISEQENDTVEWNDSRLQCDTINGSYVGDIYPQKVDLGETISIYHKSFCRPLVFDYAGSMMLESGLEGNIYEVPSRAFSCSNPDNECHCNNTRRIMPSGITDVSSCFNNISIGTSLPHFYTGDLSLLENFEGLNPSEEIHAGFYVLQPDIGMPIKISTKIQYNLMVRRIRYIKKAKLFSEMNLPIIWVDRSSEDLPNYFVNEIFMIYKYFPIFFISVSWLAAVSGLVLIVFVTFVCCKFYMRKRSAHDEETFRYLNLMKRENEINVMMEDKL